MLGDLPIPGDLPISINCFDHFLPTYQHLGDAGADLRATFSVTTVPGQKTLVDTGVKIAIPGGYVGLVLPRSGLSSGGLVAIPGTIDSGYRGKIKVLLYNIARDNLTILEGDRIAQLVILPMVQANFQRVKELPPGDRGENGFGSTGRK